jgi:hypothetical protein
MRSELYVSAALWRYRSGRWSAAHPPWPSVSAIWQSGRGWRLPVAGGPDRQAEHGGYPPGRPQTRSRARATASRVGEVVARAPGRAWSRRTSRRPADAKRLSHTPAGPGIPPGAIFLLEQGRDHSPRRWITCGERLCHSLIDEPLDVQPTRGRRRPL